MEGGSGSYPWKEGHYLGEGAIPALEITGDEGILRQGLEMKILFVPGDFGEAHPEVAEVSGVWRYTVQMKIEIAGKERLTPMVLTDDGKAFYFKSSIKTIPIGSLRWVTEDIYIYIYIYIYLNINKKIVTNILMGFKISCQVGGRGQKFQNYSR